jgi:ABC-type polysaccharide/polyol phosphate export permease
MGIKSFLGLSLAIAKAEFKLKNEGSYLGMLWYLLNPLLLFGLLLLVFGNRLGGNIPHYPLYLLLGIIIFNLFQQSTIDATKLIISNDNLIKSVHFPHAALVGGNILKALFSHIFEIIIFAGFLLFFGAQAHGIIFYPIILIFFICFILGASLLLSACSVFFLDLQNIWQFLSRLLWFATPIFYSIDNQTRLFYFNLANPLYYFITASRDILIYNKLPETWIIIGIILFAVISIIAGMLVFNRLKSKIVELI